MKHVGEPAAAAVLAAIAFFVSSFIGLAFLSYGVQSELSRLMSDGAAAIVVGVVLIAGSLLFSSGKAAATTEPVAQAQDQSDPKSPVAFLTSNLSEVVRTVIVGLSSRRPVATLALAAFAGAAILMMSTGERDAKTVDGRKLA